MTKIGQREIKFRVWLIKEQRMLEFEPPIVHEEVTTDIIFRGTGGYENLDIWHIEHVLMQYTGIKDKNGTGVYEGDIMSGQTIKTEAGKVDYHVVVEPIVYPGDMGSPGVAGFDVTNHEIQEVVGNVFEATDEQLKEWNIKREDYI